MTQEEQDMYDSKVAEIANLKSQVGKPPEGQTFVGVEDLEAINKAAKAGEIAIQGLAEMQVKTDNEVLAKEYPKLKDLALATGENLEARRVSAEALYSAFGLKKGEQDPDETPDPKSAVEPGKGSNDVDPNKRWTGAGNLGQPSQEQTAQETKDALEKEMNESIEKGDVKNVLKLCLKGQPNAVKALAKSITG